MLSTKYASRAFAVASVAAIALVGPVQASPAARSVAEPDGIALHETHSPGRVWAPLVSTSPLFVRSAQDPSLALEVTPLGGALAPAQGGGPVVRYSNVFGVGSELRYQSIRAGVEDFVRFAQAPTGSTLGYQLKLGAGIAGLRKIGSVVEFLDREGAPQLRMAPPYGVDAQGRTFAVRSRIGGCKFDEDPRVPWGRKPLDPGARTCILHLHWDPQVEYPVTIDPAWTAGSDMIAPNLTHEMLLVKLSGGRLLAVNAGASAEVFDPKSNTWASTSAPLVAEHRARLVAIEGDKALLTNTWSTPRTPSRITWGSTHLRKAIGRRARYRMHLQTMGLRRYTLAAIRSCSSKAAAERASTTQQQTPTRKKRQPLALWAILRHSASARARLAWSLISGAFASMINRPTLGRSRLPLLRAIQCATALKF
jgi:hypothetical protein